MGTMADAVAAEQATLEGNLCAPAQSLEKTESIKSAPERYSKFSLYLLSTLRTSNRPKAMEVVKALGGQVAALSGIDPDVKVRLEDLASGGDPQPHRDWYYSTKKMGKGMPVEKVVMGTLARILLEEDAEPTVEANALMIGFVELVRGAKEKYEGKSRDEFIAEFGAWFYSQVTEEEFCNGLT